MTVISFQEELTALIPEHPYFAGIDSDGCVYDSMEIKQKEFFIPAALKFFDLYPIAEFLKETWEFVNLYSIHRGSNRFLAFIKVFDLLADRPAVRESGCSLPGINSLKKWVEAHSRLSNSDLREYLKDKADQDLEKILSWSESINLEIGTRLNRVPAFPSALKAIEKVSGAADLMIISQTPFEALDREWEDHDMKKYVKIIAGQEHGTKSDHIKYAAKGKYLDNRIIMIGDAMGDLAASTDNKVLFFPIIPGKEEESWRKFNDEGLGKFLKGTFNENYQSTLIKEFTGSLPAEPPWTDHSHF
jgi:phosphoglycolate phosphatase-like HAD superfamily hydrolase